MFFENFVKSKNASVPVAVLIIGTFAVCGLALLSFSVFSADIKGEFEDLNYMEKMNTKIALYEAFEEGGLSDSRIRESLDEGSFYFTENGFEINETESVFRPKFSLNFSDWSEERLKFAVEYNE